MDCDRVETLLHAYVDGELDLTTTLTLEAHLAGCRACRERREQLGRLIGDLQAGLERYEAPAELRQRMTLTLSARQMPAESVPDTALVSLPQRPFGRPARVTRDGFGRRQLLALAASVAGIALLSGGGTYMLSRPAEGNDLAEQVVASHIRSMMATHLIDIASTDQHTVKPWFDGKVDVAPTVVDYTAQGFSLLGGRLDYLDRRPVAALVYRHRSHLINMFACPVMAGEEHETKAEALSIRGYNVLYWTAGDVTYWAVSDVNPADLLTFRNLVEEAISSHS
jgi:anti-sigma factor RsiW